jgi:hypothetical protein
MIHACSSPMLEHVVMVSFSSPFPPLSVKRGPRLLPKKNHETTPDKWLPFNQRQEDLWQRASGHVPQTPKKVVELGRFNERDRQPKWSSNARSWLRHGRNPSQASGVRRRKWGLEDVWTHLRLLMNRRKNSCGFFLMLASMFGGCSEQQVDDLLSAT